MRYFALSIVVLFVAGSLGLLWACGSDSATDANGSGTADGAAADDTGSDGANGSVGVDGASDGSKGATDSGNNGDGGGTTTTSSCGSGPGMSDCANGTESCCTSLAIAGGTFQRSYTNFPDGGVFLTANPATLSAFRLDKYEVTVGRFRQFVNAWNGGKGFVPAPGSGKHSHLNGGQGLVDVGAGADAGTYEPGWIAADDAKIAPTDVNLSCDVTATYPTWTPKPGANESRPINCANWYEAFAFCIFDGGFLPSSWEWEFAYAGGNQQRYYPWGIEAPDAGYDHAIYSCLFPTGAISCVGPTNFAPVGTPLLGVGRYGQLDLSGNVWEWNLDGVEGVPVNPCTDCASFTNTTHRSLNGGSALDAVTGLSTKFGPGPPDQRSNTNGFRCARAP